MPNTNLKVKSEARPLRQDSHSKKTHYDSLNRITQDYKINSNSDLMQCMDKLLIPS